MAEKPRTAGAADEPSIEEILGSIRRIIAEDDEPVAEPAEEPLELTNKIDPDGTIVQQEAAPEPEPQPEPVAEEPPKPAEKLAFTEEEPMPIQEDVTENLISETTAEATSAVMAKLARRTAILEEGTDTGLTIESMVRQMLRPMLREWLDGHLPDIVEKVVARELERLSKRL